MRRSPEKLKSLIEFPYVVHLKVNVLSFNKNLISSPQRDPSPSYPFRYKFGRSSKGSFKEKAKIVDRGSKCSTTESTGSNLQYEPFLFSVACSQNELSISGKIGRSGKILFTEKAKIIYGGYQSCALESTGCKPQYEPYLFSVACSQTQLSISVKIWEIR